METATTFDRNLLIHKLNTVNQWDLIVIGGGATGLGIALDAASRGFTTLLLEQSDFAKGTSSRSTKLVHGGVRYLAQGNIRLVHDALHERGVLLKNAPHLVRRQAFVIPCYNWFSKMKYLIGLKMYDWLSGRLSFGKSRLLNKTEVMEQLPGINGNNLVGGVEYFDGQFDDARLAINLAQTAVEKGGVLLNYFKVTGLLKEGVKVMGVTAQDTENKEQYSLKAKVVINATGVFVDDILQMDTPGSRPLVRPSQGVHVVLNKTFLNGSSALMIPETADGRVLFAVPWHNHVLVGTTDTPLNQHSLEPVALEKEVHFILNTMRQYMSTAPGEKDVLSVFAGLRPLAAPQKETGSTKEISRDHKLMVSPSGLITITGGKWTTYRKMGEETVNKAIETGGLASVNSNTQNIRIHGCTIPSKTHMSVYGTDEINITRLIKENPAMGKRLVDYLPQTEGEVVWVVQHEMARTVEDVLARRLRILFLDAKAALQAAPRVAEIMAAELNKDEAWIKTQIDNFSQLVKKYMLEPGGQSSAIGAPNLANKVTF